MIRVIPIVSLCLVWLTTPALADQETGQSPEHTAAQTTGQTASQSASPAVRSLGPAGTPTIELITMGEGELLWERWGHAALCVHRPGMVVVCYNYGTTNFAEPVGMVWDFLRGRSLFWVSRAARTSMMGFYTQQLDRTMWSQVLPLSPEKARLAADLLETNARGDAKYYKYHHYDDNCSTRVRDIIDRVTDGALSARTRTETYEFSLREVTRRGLSEYTAFVLLSDYAIGRRADRRPSMYEAMHLPNVLRQYVESEVGVKPVVLYQRQGRDFNVSDPPSRFWMILVILLITAPALLTWFMGRFRRLGLFISLLPGGLIGLIVWTGVIISALPEIRYNETALVAMPLDLALPWLSPLWRRRYIGIRIAGLALVALLSLVGVLHQPLWVPILLALLPIVAAALPERNASAS